MRSSKKRSRSSQNRPRSLGNIVNRVFDSSGPEGKVRGTPQQIIEKYLILARDAQLSNDRVAAENFLQHAEHYTRMLGEAQREQAERQQHQNNQQGYGNRGDDDRDDRDEGDDQPREETPRRDDRNQRRDDRQERGDRQDRAERDETEPREPRDRRREPRPDNRPEVRPEVVAAPQEDAPAPVSTGLPDAIGDNDGPVETPENQSKPKRAPRAPRGEGAPRASTPRAPRRRAEPAPDATEGSAPAENGGSA